DMDSFMNVYKLNVAGALVAIKNAADTLRKNGGSIVLFSSVAARRGFPQHAGIAAAKAGLEGLTVSLASELAPHVRVNTIAPSLTESHMAEPILSNEAMAKSLAKSHPLARLGTPEDQANAAA